MSRKLLKSLQTQKKQTEQVKLTIYGSLGITIGGQKTVQIPDRQGYVYVRLRDNQNEVIQAFNNKVAASYDLPVIVVREGSRYVVQQFNSQRYLNNAQNSAPFLPNHGTQHSFPRGGGADITWIYPQQFMPALVYPSTTTGTYVNIDRYPLYTPDNRWIYAGGTGTQNILQYLPTTGSSSLMVLVYMDAYTGNPGILVGSGTYFPANISGSIYQYIPSPSVNQIPLAGVLLNTGTTTIRWDNIYDVRQWVHATPTGTSSGGGGGGIDTIGFVGQNKGAYLATGTILNVNGNRITMSVSGTVFNLTNSPDPYDNIGIYGMSGTTGIATGTTLVVRNYLGLSSTGTFLYLNPSIGTGTFQLASGDRGVTNGDSHDHNGGDGGTIAHTSLSSIGTNTHAQIDTHIAAVVGTNAHGMREVLTAARTYYVRTDGSNSNTGLANTAGGAFLTIQKAIDIAAGLDISIYDVTIQIADGTYTAANICKSAVGAGAIIISGNSGTPANVVIAISAAGETGFLSSNNATKYVIQNLKITGAAANTYGLWIINSYVEYTNLVFNGNLIDLFMDSNSVITCTGNYSITASAGRHWYCASGGRLTCNSLTITLTGTPAWTTAFIDVTIGGSAVIYNNTYTGAATGKRANVDMNGAVQSYGTVTLNTVLPGNAIGTTATGGQLA